MKVGLPVAAAALFLHLVFGFLQSSGRLPADDRWFDRQTRGELWDEGLALRTIFRARSEIRTWLNAPDPERRASSLAAKLSTAYYGIESRLRHNPHLKVPLETWNFNIEWALRSLRSYQEDPSELTLEMAQEACRAADAGLKGIHDGLAR